jgi:hypothetical protein
MDQASETNPPPCLYKYVELTAQTLKNLKGQILYFGSPLKFNDPYDCAITPIIPPPSDDDVEIIRREFLKRNDIPRSTRQEFETFQTDKLRESLMKGVRGAMEDVTQKFLKTNGVTCFAECNNDLLMWSHYGGHYKGLCLEFSTKFDPFAKVHKVEYVKTPPVVDVLHVMLNGKTVVWELFCTKSDVWSYEKEWRAMHAEVDKEYGYPSEALIGVYFGPDIDRQILEIVCLILCGQNETVKFYKGTRSATEFKVLFKEITYTSHIEAKKKGLL